MAGTNKKKILLVEDEPVIGRLCTRVLDVEGFDVDFVQDGRKAMEAINKKNYDLCITDIRLPEITGIQLYGLVKEEHPELSNKMVFITGDTMNVNVQSFLQESGIPYLTKPFTPKDLIKKVKASLK
jgi:DNA-binding response OmpR family regulator